MLAIRNGSSKSVALRANLDQLAPIAASDTAQTITFNALRINLGAIAESAACPPQTLAIYDPPIMGKIRKNLTDSSSTPAPSDPSATSLLSGLISYWNLNEPSGNRADSFGSNTLTQTGTIARKFQAASFDNNTANYLSVASNSDLQRGTSDFTIAGWFFLRRKESYHPFITKDDITGNNREYNIAYVYSEGAISDRIVFNIFNLTLGSGGVSSIANAFGSPPTDDVMFIVADWDYTNQTARISVNNGSFNSTTGSGITNGNGSASFRMGQWDGAFGGLKLDGGQKQVGFWKRKLTTDEITFLWNSGKGRYLSDGVFV